jgi:RNA polymerase sigma-B factor
MTADPARHRQATRCSDDDELLAQFRQTGDPGAREELVRRFLPLACAIARRYRNPRESPEDLQQVASIGLLKAVQRFEPGRGAKFSTFAVPTILGELRRHFRSAGWSLHVARAAQDLVLRVEHARRALESASGRSPSVAAIAEHLKLGVDEILGALDTATARYAESLDAPVTGEEGSATLGEQLGDPDDDFELIEVRLTISSLAAELPALDRRVLALAFGADLTQTQIGEQVGVSQTQVSRIRRRALERLRELREGGVEGASDTRPPGQVPDDRAVPAIAAWGPRRAA